MTPTNDAESRARFEAWLMTHQAKGMTVTDQYSAWIGWQARDAEVAAKDERIENLQSESDAAGVLIGKLIVEHDAPPEPATQSVNADPLSEFQEGQWWIKELDAMTSAATDDQKRAIAVVHHMLRSARKSEARPTCEQAAHVVVDTDPLQGAANWLIEAIHSCGAADIQSRLSIGYNRASRLLAAAKPKEVQS